MCIRGDERDGTPAKGRVCGHVDPMEGAEGEEVVLWEVRM